MNNRIIAPSTSTQPANNQPAKHSPFIKLNEIVSNPQSGYEWVELYNSGTSSVNLSDWTICDSRLSGCKEVSGTIKPNDWFVVDLGTNRYLNNTGDSVVLFDLDHQEMDRVIYGNILGTPDKGQSLARKQDGVDTDSNSNWAITDIITKGSANKIERVVVDNIPPSVPNIKTTVSATKIIINLSSQDESSSTLYYDLKSSKDNKTWKDIANNTSTNQFIVNGQYGHKYYFRARSRDVAGNLSDWSDKNTSSYEILIDFSRQVVINEVAWAGTSADYKDRQWIELYNSTSSSIDLSNWKIVVDGVELTIMSQARSSIEPYGYYLIERYDDKTIRDIEADLIYYAPEFKKTGSLIRLIDKQNNYIDEVDCKDGWFAGGGKKYQTMRRLNSQVNGNDKSNWSASIGIRVLGRGYGTEYVYGSPRQVNLGFYALNLRQEDEEVILSPENNPHLLQFYEIPVGKKLIIKPGVIIKSYYKDANLIVYGELDASGSSTDKVIFTSGRDSSFNHNKLNTDLANWGGEAQKNDWQGLWFKSGSIGNLSNTELWYGGHSFYLDPNKPPVSEVLRAENANLNFNNVKFRQGDKYFINLQNSSSTITNTTFDTSQTAVQANQGKLTMDNIHFTNITDTIGAVQVNGFWPSLSNFTFVSTTNKTIGFNNVEFKNQIVILGPNIDFSFQSLTVDASSTLNIKSGTTLNLPTYAVMNIYGKLNSNGTAEKPVNIGVNNGWGYLYLQNAKAVLSHTNFNGGGRLAEERDGNEYVKWLTRYKDFAIELVDSDFDCRNCRIWNFRMPGNGIKSYNSSVSLVNSELGMDNKWPDYRNNYTAGVFIDGGSVFLDNVNFSNLNYGIFKTNQTTRVQPTITTQNMTPSNWVNVFREEGW